MSIINAKVQSPIFFKIIIFSLIFLLFSACDPSADNNGGYDLKEIRKFDPIDKGIRLPFHDENFHQDFDSNATLSDEDKNIKWGRKRKDWHHACASEEIQYSLSGDLISAIPFEFKAAAFLIDRGLEATGNGDKNPISFLEDLLNLSDGFSDHYWDMWNPSCSAIAAVQGVALMASKEAADYACSASPASGPSGKLSKIKKAAKGGISLIGKTVSAAGGVTIKNLVDWVHLFTKCKAAVGWQASNAAAVAFLCASGSGLPCATAKTALVKATISTNYCCGAAMAYTGVLAVALQTIKIKYTAARRHQKRVVVCGHDWHGWKVREDRANPGKFVEVRGSYHSNKNDPDPSETKFYSYRKALLDESERNNIIFDIKKQTYREHYFGGREIADPSDSDDGGCLMPQIDRGKLESIFGYYDQNNKAGKDEFRQRYYFRGSNTEPNFACQRFQLADRHTLSDDEAQEFVKAYNCCVNRSKNMICLEYINSYDIDDKSNVQPYIVKAGSGIDVVGGEEENVDQKIKKSNHPIRDNIDFCEVGSKQCSLGDLSDIPIAYEAYEHPLSNKYICARSYSVCPYNFTVGTGTFMSGTDIDYKESVGEYGVIEFINSSISSDLSFASKNREGNDRRNNDCQYMNHCTIIPGDTEGIEYSMIHDGDNYFISEACSDGKGDSQNYNFQNNLLSKKLDVKSLTAPLAQCLTESFNNLLLNKYSKDADDGSYSKGDVRSLPSFFNTIQDNLQNILRVILMCSLTLLGYKVLLAGGMERKELMSFILKLAFVLYFVTGNAWKTIFSEGLISVSTQLSTQLVKINGEDVNIFLDKKEKSLISSGSGDKIEVTELYRAESDQNEFTCYVRYDDGSTKDLRYNKDFIADIFTSDMDVCKKRVFGIDSMDDRKLLKLKNKPENGYYFKKNNRIYNISSNSICKFPKYDHRLDGENTPAYPVGKEYLKIFDTLDCMISYALGISSVSSGSSFASTIAMSLLSGFVGMSFALASLFFAISLLAVTIKILSIFCICIIYLSILIYVSPITITCVLFGRTKDVFTSWLQAVLSYSIQPVFIFIFAGFFISIFNHAIVTDDVRFEHQITDEQNQSISLNQKIAFINCNNWHDGNKIRQPDRVSIYCFFSKLYNPNDDNSTTIFPNLEVFGMYFRTSYDILYGTADGVINQGRGDSKFAAMLQIAVILYILNFLATLIPNLIVNITHGTQVGAVGGMDYSVKKLSNMAKSYGKGANDIARGLSTRYGKKSYDKVTTKRQGIRKEDD